MPTIWRVNQGTAGRLLRPSPHLPPSPLQKREFSVLGPMRPETFTFYRLLRSPKKKRATMTATPTTRDHPLCPGQHYTSISLLQCQLANLNECAHGTPRLASPDTASTAARLPRTLKRVRAVSSTCAPPPSAAATPPVERKRRSEPQLQPTAAGTSQPGETIDLSGAEVRHPPDLYPDSSSCCLFCQGRVCEHRAVGWRGIVRICPPHAL